MSFSHGKAHSVPSPAFLTWAISNFATAGVPCIVTVPELQHSLESCLQYMPSPCPGRALLKPTTPPFKPAHSGGHSLFSPPAVHIPEGKPVDKKVSGTAKHLVHPFASTCSLPHLAFLSSDYERPASGLHGSDRDCYLERCLAIEAPSFLLEGFLLGQ